MPAGDRFGGGAGQLMLRMAGRLSGRRIWRPKHRQVLPSRSGTTWAELRRADRVAGAAQSVAIAKTCIAGTPEVTPWLTSGSTIVETVLPGCNGTLAK